LVGVDLLDDALTINSALDVRVVRDVVADGLPTEAAGAYLVTSRWVLEHVEDLARFAHNVCAALEPGGWTLHLFSSRFSLFALLNRFPDRVTRPILFRLRGESVDVGGFSTFYDRTDPVAAAQVFKQAGFTDITITVSYEVSQYFRFFFPLYVCARCWETAVRALGAERLSAYVLLQARRQPGNHVDGARSLTRGGGSLSDK
jgi:hypothetical protein